MKQQKRVLYYVNCKNFIWSLQEFTCSLTISETYFRKVQLHQLIMPGCNCNNPLILNYLFTDPKNYGYRSLSIQGWFLSNSFGQFISFMQLKINFDISFNNSQELTKAFYRCVCLSFLSTCALIAILLTQLKAVGIILLKMRIFEAYFFSIFYN